MDKENKELKMRFKSLIDDFCNKDNANKRKAEFEMNEIQRINLARKLKKALI